MLSCTESISAYDVKGDRDLNGVCAREYTQPGSHHFCIWRTVMGTGAAVRKGGACGITRNAEVGTEGAKLLRRIKFKEGREG